MAFKDVFTFKQAILKEMEAMGYYKPYGEDNTVPPPVSEALENDFNNWVQYYMYKHYQSFKHYSEELETVVLSKEDIINYYNSNLERIIEITNDSVNITRWEENDFLPYLELVSLPIFNSDGSLKSKGFTVENEKNASNYALCYQDLYNPYPLIEEGEEERYTVSKLAIYGRGNNGRRGGGIPFKPNTDTLNRSSINLLDIQADNRWEFIKTTMLSTGGYDKWFTFVPLEPINEWGGEYRQSGQWVFKGKNPTREKDVLRSLYYYKKFNILSETTGEVIGYRYIPLTPFLEQVLSGNTMTQSTVISWRNGFLSNNEYPSIGYQPYNYHILYDIGKNSEFTNNYLFSLPGITYTQSESLNILCVSVSDFSLSHTPYQMFMQYYELGQYFYLCGIKFEIDETRAANLPYNQLLGGFPPEIVEGGGGEGETAGPSGTTSGGDKEELSGVGGSVSSDTIIRKYPVQEHNLTPGFYGGVYIPTYRHIMEITSNNAENDLKVEEMNRIINNAVRYGKGDSIVESFITYSGFINSTGIDEVTGEAYDYRYFLPGIGVSINRPVYLCGYDSADTNTYIPKNNKLLTYPYVSFEINGYGERNELKYENWSTEQPRVLICSKFLPGACIFVFPENYEGVKYNYDAGVASQPLPILPYTIDKFKNEYNATINSRTASVTSLTETSISNGIYSVLGGAAGIGAVAGRTNSQLSPVGPQGPLPYYNQLTTYNMTGGMAGGVAKSAVDSGQGLTGALMSYHQGMREFEAQLRDVENRPLAIANQNAAPSLPALNSNSAAPYIVWKSIRKEFAQKIDDFFTRYGYKVSKYKEVDIHTRPVYNFLKCNQARVEGSIPNEDLMQIKTILEKGITFWHDPSKILDYSVDNPAPKKDAPVYLNPSYNK